MSLPALGLIVRFALLVARRTLSALLATWRWVLGACSGHRRRASSSCSSRAGRLRYGILRPGLRWFRAARHLSYCLALARSCRRLAALVTRCARSRCSLDPSCSLRSSPAWSLALLPSSPSLFVFLLVRRGASSAWRLSLRGRVGHAWRRALFLRLGPRLRDGLPQPALRWFGARPRASSCLAASLPLGRVGAVSLPLDQVGRFRSIGPLLAGARRVLSVLGPHLWSAGLPCC